MPLTINATDSVPGQVLNYAASGLPPGLQISTVSGQGIISGTPSSAGTYNPVITVTDSLGTISSITFTWFITSSGGNVVTVNNPGSKTNTTANYISPLTITASDSQSGQTLTFSATGLPPGLSINSSTGVISGFSQIKGTYNVTVSAIDTTGAKGSTTFSWNITGGGLVGATVTAAGITNTVVSPPFNNAGLNQTQVISFFDNVLGAGFPLAATVEKIFWGGGGPSTWWTTSSTGWKNTLACINSGARLLVSMRPSVDPTNAYTGTTFQTDFTNVTNAINMLKSANAVFDIVFTQEANRDSEFISLSNPQAAYAAYCNFYGPAVRNASIPLVYCPTNATGSQVDPVTFYPGDALCDKIMLDLYCSAFDFGKTGDALAAVADAHQPFPISFGIGEWNNQAGTGSGQTQAQMQTFWNYLFATTGTLGLFQKRLNAGKTNGDIIWWQGDHATNRRYDQILSSSDANVPLLRATYTDYNLQ